MTSPFHTTPRGPMSRQDRARIFDRRGGICGDVSLGADNWGCGRKIRPPADKWQVEHSKALQNGGKDTAENLFVICEFCLSKKNADDAGEAADNRHKYTNHVVPKERSRAWGRQRK